MVLSRRFALVLLLSVGSCSQSEPAGEPAPITTPDPKKADAASATVKRDASASTPGESPQVDAAVSPSGTDAATSTPGPDGGADPVPAGPVMSYPTAGSGGPTVVDLETGDVCSDWESKEGEVVIDGWSPYVWLPGGIKTIRCMLGGAGYLNELARIHHCGVIRQPPPSAATLTAVLKKYGEMSGHPELEFLQVIGSGYSAAYGKISGIAKSHPERFMALFGGGIHTASPTSGPLLFVPWLSFNGNQDSAYIREDLVDMGSNHPWWAHNVGVARAQGGLFGHTVRWNVHHEVGDSRHLMFPFIHEIIPLRAPKAGTPITTITPTSLKAEDGWLVSTQDWNTAFPTVASYKDWKGDRNKASWAPTAFMAHAMRAYTAKNSPVTITEPMCKSDSCVPRSAGAKSQVPFVIEVKGPAPQKVELYDGDRLLFAMPGPPWQVVLTDFSVGVHAFNAVATYADGKKAVSNLRSVLVTRPRGNVACPPKPAPVTP